MYGGLHLSVGVALYKYFVVRRWVSGWLMLATVGSPCLCQAGYHRQFCQHKAPPPPAQVLPVLLAEDRQPCGPVPVS